MTAAQKKNITRFKQVQAEAKKLKAKNKNLTHLAAVKQAWAIILHKTPAKKKAAPKKAAKKKAAKKVGAVKKKAAPKKAAKKKATTKKASVRNYGSHKDTGSHNVKISVMSGNKSNKLESEILQKLNKTITEIMFFEYAIKQNTLTVKQNPYMKKSLSKTISTQKKLLAELKKHKIELKKLL